MFAQIVSRGARVVEHPIPTRYFLEASSVSFRDSVAYGVRTLVVLARFRLHERGRSWRLLTRPAAELPGSTATASFREPGSGRRFSSQGVPDTASRGR
jgi:hypothetical protein